MEYMTIVQAASKAAQEGHTEAVESRMNDALQALDFPRCFGRMVQAARSVYRNSPTPGEY